MRLVRGFEAAGVEAVSSSSDLRVGTADAVTAVDNGLGTAAV